MSFSVRIKESAAKELRRVAKPDRTRIVAAIDRLAEAPYLGVALKGGLKGLRRIRVGNYRILYEIRHDQLVVLVVRVVHRREAYRPTRG
ncbi:MAG: type II toxin-antitoxin system RelE/ParE family toxin [Gammaproteobacteria bacterium]|nr:type II toxin-antitoxin system RelE/ParE family toxin [Gammaproteobacteria bacterium]MDE0247785.1 type II toxin-antitoxin system RelE/ParE family toxin [Gammaproteobacteria bacterium]